MPRVAPSGRLPDDFASRCLEAARSWSRSLQAERAALALGARLARLRAASSGGDARRTPIATRKAPDDRRKTPARTALSRELRAAIRLAASFRGEPDEGLGPGLLAIPGTALTVDRRGHLRQRPTIPGSSIVVGSARTSQRRLVHAARRLGKALAVIDAAWPEAGREVRGLTRVVIPRDEPGLVSYSLPSRPGVSFLNLRGKRLIDLADDLLHETAHHALHEIEGRAPLVVPERRGDAHEEPRFWSPWRRSLRPARGLLHACFTFMRRAELFARILEQARAGGGRVGSHRVGAPLMRELGREARKETRWIDASLRDLQDASRRGLTTAAGKTMVRRMRSDAARVRRLRARASHSRVG